MLLLNKNDIQTVFTMQDAIQADKLAFQIFSQGNCEIPLRTNIPVEQTDNCFLSMPVFSKSLDAAALKVINIFPDNGKMGLPSSYGEVLLMDGKTGAILSMMDGGYVTQLRTGAASGVAMELLGRIEGRTGALIGTGGQAAAQLEALLTARELERIYIAGRDYQKTQSFVEKMKEKFKEKDTQLIPVETCDEAIKDADYIIAVTSSRTPVFSGDLVKPGATLSFVGSYQPDMQEMPPSLLERASKIYFDSKEAVLEEAGDLIIPMRDGIISQEDFTGDIGQVLLGEIPGRESQEEIIVFKTVGIAAQDLVTSRQIYEKAKLRKIGIDWN